MNPLNASGSATVTAIDNVNQIFTYALGNGENFLTITTSGGESISELSGVVIMPEPASMALLGTALAGLGFAIRRRWQAFR